MFVYLQVKSMEQDGKDSYETMFLMAAEERGENDVVFFKRLDEELKKVNSFYRSRVEELVKEANELDKQMSSLLAFRAIVRSKPDQCFTTTDIEGNSSPNPARFSGMDLFSLDSSLLLHYEPEFSRACLQGYFNQFNG